MRFSATSMRAGLAGWQRSVRRHSKAAIESMLLLAHLRGLFARGKMRAVLHRWGSSASQVKAERRLQRELGVAHRTISELQDENSRLREAMETLACEALWQAAHDKEASEMRAALTKAHDENAELARSRDALKERYHRLRQTTSDPNYILPVDTPGAVIMVGPARDDGARAAAALQADGRPRKGPTGAFSPPPRSPRSLLGQSISASEITPRQSPSAAELSTWVQTRHATTLRGSEMLGSYFDNLPDEVRARVEEALRARSAQVKTATEARARAQWHDHLSPNTKNAKAPKARAASPYAEARVRAVWRDLGPETKTPETKTTKASGSGPPRRSLQL